MRLVASGESVELQLGGEVLVSTGTREPLCLIDSPFGAEMSPLHVLVCGRCGKPF